MVSSVIFIMWSLLAYALLFTSSVASKYIMSLRSQPSTSTIFKDEQMIFKSNFNITSILVPSDSKFMHANDVPSIFFTVSDPRLEGGSCIYVLEEISPYEVLEGGRDSTADYGSDKSVYFGAKDGLYQYDPDTISARRYGVFRDDIIQLQKANGSDTIFILTAQNKLFKIENRGTVKTKVDAVTCALEFVLDTSNNIYYINCKDRMIHIVHSNGTMHDIIASVMEEFDTIKLLRPAFVMDESVPFFGNNDLHIVFSNGMSEKKELNLIQMPSAISVDSSLYLVAAVNGKIYEFNIMDVFVNSMFNTGTDWLKDVSEAVSSMIYTAKSVYNYYNIKFE